jgi:hypothetical protein
MPSTKPQGAASEAGKTSLARQPAPGDRRRSKAIEQSGRGGPPTPRCSPNLPPLRLSAAIGVIDPSIRTGEGAVTPRLSTSPWSRVREAPLALSPGQGARAGSQGPGLTPVQKGVLLHPAPRPPGRGYPARRLRDRPRLKVGRHDDQGQKVQVFQSPHRRSDAREGRGDLEARNGPQPSVEENPVPQAAPQPLKRRDSAFDKGPVGVEAQAVQVLKGPLTHKGLRRPGHQSRHSHKATKNGTPPSPRWKWGSTGPTRSSRRSPRHPHPWARDGAAA